MNLEKNVQIYLKQALQSDKPLLLGFSGGEDSLALAYCFIRLNIPFHIAHYDHAWRESSLKEALELKNWATQRGIPFHTSRSKEKAPSELIARQERYHFFQNLFLEQPFQALVLAHHREDQVETILKRVFEGAHLSKLRGMHPARQIGEMEVWRPLLETSKEAIRLYLKEHGLIAIDDFTNRDPKYLRARMRTSLVPFLQENFGKEVSHSIIRLGKYASELEEYLESQTQRLAPIEGPFGVMWDFSKADPLEVRFVLSQYFRKKGENASEKIFEKILSALKMNKGNFKISFADQKLIVDRGHLFIIKAEPPQFLNTISFKECKVEDSGWQWEVQIKPRAISAPPQNWRNWWQGKISLNIPNGNYDFKTLNSKFRKLQNNHKVPAFLRESLPILVLEDRPIGEFLTGKNLLNAPEDPICLSISVIKIDCLQR